MRAWSWSSYTKYETCPRQYYETRVVNNYVDEPGVEAIWGVEVHKAAENLLLHDTPLPDRMKVYADPIYKVKDFVNRFAEEYSAELELGVKKDLSPSAFDDPDCYARCIIDVVAVRGGVGLNLDYKTGKVKDSKQLQMSSAIMFANFPTVETIHAGFVWLAHDITTRKTYHRKDDNWAAFQPTLNNMKWSYDNNSWPARPSGLCKGYCPVKTCEHWGPKRIKK